MMEGRRLADRFLILKVIGTGGATELCLAQDAQLGELVALRILDAAYADRWEALRDACRDTRPLAHTHIARVFDYYRSDDAAFVCREYFEGASLAEFSGRSTSERLAAFAEVAAALDAAHAFGVVHGDLKTTKVLRDVRGNFRVIDFRIAAALRTAAPVATAADHLSPQVRAGEAPVAADDVYSLGVAVAQIVAAEDTPRELQPLIDAMRAEQRDARPSDLREIEQALGAYADGGERSSEVVRPAPPLLRPAAAPSAPSLASAPAPAERRAFRNLQYALASGALALAAVVVFFALPRWVDSPRDTELAIEQPTTAEEVIAAPTREAPDASKESVEVLLAELVPLRDALEAAAVERWAADDFERANVSEKSGDEAFLDGDYADAYEHYTAASRSFEGLIERRGGALTTALEQGREALAAGDAERAIEAFDLALAIDAGNTEAGTGARRAANIGAVMEHMSAGSAFETEDALDSARDEYARAAELDPEYAPAREALARVEAASAEREFESNLSLALVALANGDLRSARSRFEAARALRPNSPEVADGLRQLRQTETSRAIASLRERAQSAERAEQWNEAATLYQKIIDIQSNLSFAEEGLRRNRELARIAGRVDALIEDPTQLFVAETVDEAKRLIEEGRRHAEGRPQLADRVASLEIAVKLASTPIPVVFESDSVTEVVIRGIGTLGNFSRRDVPLKPGRYVAVGHRDGYRDARSEFDVLPGRQHPVVEIRCTEKI